MQKRKMIYRIGCKRHSDKNKYFIYHPADAHEIKFFRVQNWSLDGEEGPWMVIFL